METRLRIGFANQETWIFLQNIYDHFTKKYPTEIFQPKKSRWPILKKAVVHRQQRNSLRYFLEKHDVVFFEWASALLVEASKLQTDHSAAIVTRLHRYEMFRWVDQINWDAVDCVVLDTDAMRKKLIERTTMSADRTIVIPPVAIDQDRFDLSQRPFEGKIGILSNLIPRKRVYELILAFYALSRSYPNLTLHIGGGPHPEFRAYYEALDYLVEQLNLQDHVRFYGRIDKRWEWYRKMDIFVSFSYSEGMQVAPLEAAASGCYCISHWWQGAEEVFAEGQRFLTEDQFTSIVATYCDTNDEGRKALRQPLVEFVSQQCDSVKICQQLEQVLIEAVHA